MLDRNFLKQLDNFTQREVYAKIISLDWNENAIAEITGNIVSGNISVDGSSATRRTCSLTVISDNKNAQLNEIPNARFYTGDILTCLTKWRKEGFIPDVLVVDPPRTGLDLRLLNYLQQFPVSRIVYVSCNPATLAKNCNHLQKKYHILQIQPLDMFPQTCNVECVVCLERRQVKIGVL